MSRVVTAWRGDVYRIAASFPPDLDEPGMGLGDSITAYFANLVMSLLGPLLSQTGTPLVGGSSENRLFSLLARQAIVHSHQEGAISFR